MAINQTDQTKTWVLTRPTDGKVGFSQAKHTKIRVLTRPNRPKFEFETDQTD